MYTFFATHSQERVCFKSDDSKFCTNSITEVDLHTAKSVVPLGDKHHPWIDLVIEMHLLREEMKAARSDVQKVRSIKPYDLSSKSPPSSFQRFDLCCVFMCVCISGELGLPAIRVLNQTSRHRNSGPPRHADPQLASLLLILASVLPLDTSVSATT
ncbi:hypothetical protein EVAR_7291_1 [Eumeta japonica]|uniref:Uncharacterized protein n=1 Tax=Eumeta variegata TaxID=151549 RepID=A0A4C1T558_EUMVA|nr:hypothetical protein EVAR_7291_1 [Eumeta japonica]